MAEGTGRRTVTKDRLATQQGVEPVRLTGPGVRAPQMQQPQQTVAGQIYKSLGVWANEKLKEVANKDRERQMMDGAMASVQGDTMEQLEMDGGNKWALQGYRVMTAQTISSGLTAARKQQIEETDFALDPDQFREKYVQQLGQAVEGQDPKTARMIREQMTQALPGLVAQHTLANVNFLEGQNFDAVKRSIDVMSRDAQGIGELLNIVQGGDGSPAAALSAGRLSGAVSEGIVLAFTNMNPRAYDLLKVSGALDGMSTEELNRINNAKVQYQTKLKKELNLTRLDKQMALTAEIKTGALTPTEATRRQIELNKEFNIDTDFNAAQATWEATVDPNRTAGKTRANVMAAATKRQDWTALAHASSSIIKFVESGNLGNTAVGPVVKGGANKGDQAISEMQVMPNTLKKPGFGVKPWDGTLADAARVGNDYWIMNVVRYEGDLEAAAIGYHAGPGNADEWIKNGRDYDKLPRPADSKEYWRKFKKAQDDQEFPLAGDKFNESVHQLKLANEAFDLAAAEDSAPRLAELDMQYSLGEIDRDQWKADRKAVTDEYEGLRNVAMVNYETNFTKQVVAAVRKDVGKRTTAAQADALQAAMMQSQSDFNAVVNNPQASMQEKREALLDYRNDREAVLDHLKIGPVDAKRGQFLEQAFDAVESAWPARQKFLKEEAEIGGAIKRGSVSLLSVNLRKRAFDRATADFTKDAQDNLASSGGGEEAEAAFYEAMDSGHANMYSDLGQVDPRMKASESAIALRPMLDKDGNPSEAFGAMVGRYQRMILTDPIVARGYLTEKARNRVDAIIAMTGGLTSAGEIAQAQTDWLLPSATRGEVTAFIKAERSQVAIKEAIDSVREHNDTKGFWQLQAIFNSDADIGDAQKMLTSELRRSQSAKTTDAMTLGMEAELSALYAVDQDIPLNLLVKTAEDNLAVHSGIIGGDFVNMNIDILDAMFPGQSNQFNKANIKHNVVLSYLKFLGEDSQRTTEFGFIKEFGEAEALTPLVQAVFANSFFGAVGDWTAGLDSNEFTSAVLRGVRPFKAFSSPDGQQLYVRVFLPDGSFSEPIPIPLREAGDIYRAENPLF